MSTTTIRLPEDLKQRIAQAAERAGISSHLFILQAVEEKAHHEEALNNFSEQADIRFANILKTGETIAWLDMRTYLENKMQGLESPLPKSRKKS